MTREEMLADLAYARTLAEEGRHAPLIGGRYLVLFGALLCVAPASATSGCKKDRTIYSNANVIQIEYNQAVALHLSSGRSAYERV